MRIILASQSKQRQNVLRNAGYKFEVIPADLDEKSIRCDDWKMLPMILARAKAHAIARKINEPAMIIASDQVVICNGELREKPENDDQARYFLESYARYPAEPHTSVYVLNTANVKSAEQLDIVKIFFKQMPKDTIEKLIAMRNIFNAAGGFYMEDPLIRPYVVKQEGAIGSNEGFSLETVKKLMNIVTT